MNILWNLYLAPYRYINVKEKYGLNRAKIDFILRFTIRNIFVHIFIPIVHPYATLSH